MKSILKIPFLGVLIYLTISAMAEKTSIQESPRPKRSFGISNPIFSRVFNPYDNRPLSEKFFGHDYTPAPAQRDGPQFYPLWYSQPTLNDGDSVEGYPRRENYPLSWRMENSYTPHPKTHAEASEPYPAPSKPYPESTKPYPAPLNPHPVSSKPYPAPTKPCTTPAPSKPYPAPTESYPTSSKPDPALSKPYPAPSKPYPSSSKPYPAPSKPYPAPSKPYPAPSKPYPAPSKPYPAPSKPYPAPTEPRPTSSKPYPLPSKPYPAPEKPHQSAWKPVIGRLFVDEVDKTLHFETNPETGELVPVLTEGKKNTKPHNFDTFSDHETEEQFKTHEPTENSLQTTTTIREEEQERGYEFKLLPHYDIQTKFNSSIPCSSTTESTSQNEQIDQENLSLKQKLNELEQDEKKREKERITWKLKMQKKYEEKRQKILREIYGEDESTWPVYLSEAAIKIKKKYKEDQENQVTTSTAKIQTEHSFKSLPHFDIRSKFVEDEDPKSTSTVRPIFVLPNHETLKAFQEEPPKVSCGHKITQTGKIGSSTRNPCLTENSKESNQNRFVQLFVYTEKPPMNLAASKNPSFYDVIVPHSTKNTADYSQFLAAPSLDIYQKFRDGTPSTEGSTRTSTAFVQPPLTRKSQILLKFQDGQSLTFQPPVQKISPSRGLEFRVFKNKLDQSVLDSLKKGRDGKIDTSKLEELTQRIIVEPVNKNDPNVRKQLKTLESLSKTFDFLKDRDTIGPFSTYEFPSRNYESSESNSTFNIATVTSRKNELQQYFDVGHIPLDKHKIWDSEDRVLKNSYGQKIITNI